MVAEERLLLSILVDLPVLLPDWPDICMMASGEIFVTGVKSGMSIPFTPG